MHKRLLLLILCGLLTFSCTACGEENPGMTRDPITLPSTDQTYPVTYVPDKAVNRFILALKEVFERNSAPQSNQSNSQTTGTTGANNIPQRFMLNIEQGNAAGEYVLTINECKVTVSAHKAGLGVVIVGGRGENGQKKLLAAFEQIALAGDKSCTQDQLKAARAFMQQQTEASGSYRVSNDVHIQSFLPSVEVQGAATNARLDLLLTNFVAAESAE